MILSVFSLVGAYNSVGRVKYYSLSKKTMPYLTNDLQNLATCAGMSQGAQQCMNECDTKKVKHNTILYEL